MENSNTKTAVFDSQTGISLSKNLINRMKDDAALSNASNLDDAYEAFKKFAQITREDFNKIYEFGVQIDKQLGSNGQQYELNEEELDSVVGGNFLGNVWGSVKSAASSISSYAKDTWNGMPDWAHYVIIGAGIGAAAGLLFFTGGAAAYAGALANAVAAGQITGGTIAGLAVAWTGIGAAAGAITGGIVSAVKN